MTEPLEQFRATLKQHSLSLTNSRETVFKALQDKEPQTMRELVAACQASVNRASVYRTIALFERLDIVQRLQMGWKYKLELSDSFHHHHHHLSCLSCGAVIPLAEDNELESRLLALAASKQFLISGHQLEIQGLCSKCSLIKRPELDGSGRLEASHFHVSA